MFKPNYVWTDHNIQTNFHEPCEKDLRISYLEQYQLNNTCCVEGRGYENNRQHSKNNLKQITDKYGFYWDQKGKLLKIRDKYQKKNVEENKRVKNKQNKKKKQDLVQKSRQKQRKLYISPMKIQQHNTTIKHEIKNIDQRINKIVNKYQPNKNISKSNTNNIHQDYCKCQNRYQPPSQKQYQKISFRVQTEDNFNDVPYFRACNVQQYKPIQRSKSTNQFARNHRFSYNNGEPIQKNFYQNDFSRQKYCSRTLQKKKDKRGIVEVQDPSQKQLLDNKIDMITQKIKQFQKEKQRLEIGFKKFELRQRPKTPQKLPLQRQYSKLTIQIEEKVPSSQQEEVSLQIKRPEIDEEDFLQNKIKMIEDHIKTYQQPLACIETPKRNKERIIQNFQQLTLQKKQNKKRKITNKGLLSKFCQQIELDQQFRNAKLWFQSNEDPHKWGIIADKLQMDGMTLKYKQLVQIFSCQAEQHNPFFSNKSSHENYSSLITKFKGQETHWKEQIQNNFTDQQLQMEEFNSRQLDVEQKGYIRVEDLVRFINMRTKNFYRSRDLILIFQRFAGKQKKQVHFSRVKQVLTG